MKFCLWYHLLHQNYSSLFFGICFYFKHAFCPFACLPEDCVINVSESRGQGSPSTSLRRSQDWQPRRSGRRRSLSQGINEGTWIKRVCEWSWGSDIPRCRCRWGWNLSGFRLCCLNHLLGRLLSRFSGHWYCLRWRNLWRWWPWSDVDRGGCLLRLDYCVASQDQEQETLLLGAENEAQKAN